MVKAFEDHETYVSIPEPHKENIKQDICTLQLSESELIFETAYLLFKEKWLKINSNKIQIKKFFEYFEGEWIVKHPGWYEGYAPGVPSTNNGLESTNRVIKDEGTYRIKLSLGRFLEVVKTNIVERWSIERDETKPFAKPFTEKVKIDHKLWVQSFHLSLDDRPTCHITDKQKKKTSFMSSGRCESGKQLVTATNIQKEVKQYKNFKTKKSWSSFDQFCDYQTRLWQSTFVEDEDKWLTSTCNCSQNQKQYICTHVILQAIRAGFVEVPNTAKTVPLHDMPKRGRPARVSKALQIDNQPQKNKKRKQNSPVGTTNKKSRK